MRLADMTVSVIHEQSLTLAAANTNEERRAFARTLRDLARQIDAGYAIPEGTTYTLAWTTR